MKIIFFCSNPTSWSIAFHEAILAKALSDVGHDCLFITPGSQFYKKSNLLKEKILRNEFDLKGYSLDRVIDQNDLNQADSILKEVDKENFENLVIDGVKVGKIALYEIIITNKKINACFSDEEWSECKRHIKNTVISLLACRKIILREKPDRIIMYNTLYSVNHAWERYAESKKIPTYFIHHSPNLASREDELMIGRNNTIQFSKLIKEKEWPKYKNIPVSKNRMSSITDHFLKLLEGKNIMVYSTPKNRETVNIRNIFGIKSNQKILVATLSSYDEIFAGNYVEAGKESSDSPFKDQIDWVMNLTEHLKNRSDLFLIVRVHPREFPNRRESIKSEHARRMEKCFEDLPTNVKINWPDQKISLYDLAGYADVFLNAWSNAGTEMSMLGLPVVIYSAETVFYTPDINYVGRNKEDYFAKIDQAIREGWSANRIINVYRWLSLFYMETVIKVREKNTFNQDGSVASKIEHPKFNLYRIYSLSPKHIKKIIRFILKNLGVKGGQDLINKCRIQLEETIDIAPLEKMLQKANNSMIDREKMVLSAPSADKEKEQLLKELARIYEALYPREENDGLAKERLQGKLMRVIKKYDSIETQRKVE